MRRVVVVAVIAVAAAGAAIWLLLPPGDALNEITPASADFDRAFALPGSPQGIATDGRELVTGNRRDPWGAMRIRPRRGDGFRGEVIPILETIHRQKMDPQIHAWNGTHYVGYASESWFRRATGYVFTMHDRDTLQTIRHVPAPNLLGCLAWDGKGYWGATRRNTRDADEEAFLYRFDRDLKVVEKREAPSVGCQGMAWDGRHLWIADVFDDAIYVVDVSGTGARVVSRTTVNVEYPSGLVFFGGEIWLTDYGKNRLQRIKPSERIAWSGASDVAAKPALARVVPAIEKPKVLTASRKNSFAKFRSDDTEIVEWSIAIRDDVLRGSWRFWFGGDVFARGEQASAIVTVPQFAKYTLTIRAPGGSETEKEFNAFPGENVMNDVELAPAREPGEYTVSVFMHVQYVTAAGEARILNNSAGSLSVTR